MECPVSVQYRRAAFSIPEESLKYREPQTAGSANFCKPCVMSRVLVVAMHTPRNTWNWAIIVKTCVGHLQRKLSNFVPLCEQDETASLNIYACSVRRVLEQASLKHARGSTCESCELSKSTHTDCEPFEFLNSRAVCVRTKP